MNDFTVRKGRRYRAKLALGVLESLASNEAIGARFLNLGFVEVSVEGGGAVRTVEALWPGEEATAPLPPQIVQISELDA